MDGILWDKQHTAGGDIIGNTIDVNAAVTVFYKYDFDGVVKMGGEFMLFLAQKADLTMGLTKKVLHIDLR